MSSTRADDFAVDFFLFDFFSLSGSRASDRLRASIDRVRFVAETDKDVDQIRKNRNITMRDRMIEDIAFDIID